MANMKIDVDLSEVDVYVTDSVTTAINDSIREEVDKVIKPIIRRILKAKREALENEVMKNYEKFLK